MSWALLPLTEEQREIQRLAREFAQTEIVPHTAAWDRDAHFERSVEVLANAGIAVRSDGFVAHQLDRVVAGARRGLYRGMAGVQCLVVVPHLERETVGEARASIAATASG